MPSTTRVRSTLGSPATEFDQLQFPEGTLQEALFPYITPSGIPFVRDPGNPDPKYPQFSIDETADRLRPLDPDCLLFVTRSSLAKVANQNYDAWETGLLTFAMPVPTSVHRGNYLREDEQEWYRSLPDEERYEWPDGSIVEELGNLGGEDFAGNHHELYDIPVPSPFAPGTVEHHVDSVTPFIDQGYSIIYFDQTNYVSRQGLDFSEWGQSSFRAHLRELPATRREELGIDDPSSFDLRDYLRSNGLIDSKTPAEDPVFREYFLHQHQRIRAFYQEVVEKVRNSEHPQEDISFHPNLGTGPDLRFAPATAIYTADAFDVATFESYGRLPTVPPHSFTDYRYKLFQAAGRFERPAMQFQTELSATQARALGIEPESEVYTTLAQLQAAVAFANGGRAAPELLSDAHADPVENLTRWMDVDSSVPDDLSAFVDFVRSNRRFIEDSSPANRTALVFSLPTMLWNYVPQHGWGPGVHPEEYLDSFIGVAGLLREQRVPYDVVVFDQPRLWTAPEQLERLASYDVVILPNTDAMSDAQLDRLEEVLDDGTAVIASGPPPRRDARYRPTERPTELLRGHSNATVLEGDPAGRFKRDETTGESFAEALEEATDRHVELSGDGAIGVNVMAQPMTDRFIVHLLNYEYRLDDDATRTQSHLELTVTGPPLVPGVATYYTPGSVTELDVDTTEDRVTVIVPELNIWGFVVFATDSSAVESGDQGAAEEAIAAAASAVERAESDGRIRGLPTAKNYLTNARSAHTYDSHASAVKTAERATEAAEAAYRNPTIGIDVGHGQPESGMGFEAFATLRERQSSYSFERVETWTPDRLAAIDVLLIPPAYEFKGVSYEFDQAEFVAFKEFIDTGGCGLVLARGGAANELVDLVELFEFEVDPRVDIFHQGAPARATTTRHPLTKMTVSIDVQHGTPLRSVPPSATVLARLPDETPAIVRRPGDDGNHESAADEIAYAVRPFGRGQVGVIGSPSPFTDPIDNLYAVRNAVKELGRRARYARRTAELTPTLASTVRSTPTATTTNRTSIPKGETPSESPTQVSSTTTDPQPMPGFGIGAAISGLATFSALLKWHIGDSGPE